MTKEMRLQREVSAPPGTPSTISDQDGDTRWHAIVARDPVADALFFYSVQTTGIYCRPSCPAKRPNRSNVSYYASAEEAEKAGFRPCLRCRPREASQAERHGRIVTQACRTIESAEEPPTLSELAAAAKLSSFHFHRIFKSITGVTPKAFANAHRTQRARERLKTDLTVTESIYASGFNTASRFYECSGQTLGMTPTAFRSGGDTIELRFAVGECSLGAILVAASEKGICAVSLGDNAEALVQAFLNDFPNADIKGGDPQFEEWVAGVVALVETPAEKRDIPLDILGTAFQQKVWQALREIPIGTTRTYSEIAIAVGLPGGARAVARACATNRVAVAIPCHRVVRIGSALSGYRWGISRKAELLRREKP